MPKTDAIRLAARSARQGVLLWVKVLNGGEQDETCRNMRPEDNGIWQARCSS